MMFRLLVCVVFALSVPQTTTAHDTLRQVEVGVMLDGESYHVYAEHGVPNGMPCEWYVYATVIGLPPCAHPGIDLDAHFEPVYAATNGVIEFAGPDEAYWPMHVDIRVSSQRYRGELHIYGHLSEVRVVAGQKVRKGDLLGITGTAGSGPHLHFERRSAPSAEFPLGQALDPMPVLSEVPYRPTKRIR